MNNKKFIKFNKILNRIIKHKEKKIVLYFMMILFFFITTFTAVSAPVQNDLVGFWEDSFSDDTGIDLTNSSSITVSGGDVIFDTSFNWTVLDDWEIMIVDSIGDVGKYNSITIDSGRIPHIVYYDETNNKFKYAYWSGIDWNKQFIPDNCATGIDLTEVINPIDIAIDSFNNLHITYFCGKNKSAYYIRWNGSGWDSHTEISELTKLPSYSIAIAVDSSDIPNVAYNHSQVVPGKIFYTKGPLWNLEEANSSVTNDNTLDIDLDSTGTPYIAYYDNINSEIKYSKKNGIWNTGVVYAMINEFGKVPISVDVDSADKIWVVSTSFESIFPFLKQGTIYKYMSSDGGNSWERNAFTTGKCDSTSCTFSNSSSMVINPPLPAESYDNLEISYVYTDGVSETNSLRYGANITSNINWPISPITVDSTVEVGSTSIDEDDLNFPRIAYFDKTNNDLRYAGPPLAGVLVSKEIVPSTISNWDKFFVSDDTASGSIVYSILDGVDFSVLKNNVVNGEDISDILVSAHPTIRLKAMITASGSNPPVSAILHSWKVTWQFTDTTPPILTTEAWIPDDATGTYIPDGGVVNLDDIDEASEYFNVYSTASDASGIWNQKIKWFRYDSSGTFISGGSSEWWLGSGSKFIKIPGPLNDGDRIEYQSEATDTVSNTAYNPIGSDACVATDPNPCAERYSFTVREVKTWVKTFGENGFSESFRYIKQTSDGGYIVIGERCINLSLDCDFLLIKLYSSGTQEWAKTFGESGFNNNGDPNIDYGFSVQEVAGGYIIAGESKSFAPNNASEFMVIKLDSNGNKIWTRTFDAGVGVTNEGRSILDVGDGYLIGGASGGNITLFKIDYSGNNILWQKVYGPGNVLKHFIANKVSGGYIIAYGSGAYSSSSSDGVIMKIDFNGNVIWTKVFGEANWDRFESVIETSDGEYLAVGYTENFSNNDTTYDIFVLKLLSNGNVDWAYSFYDNETWGSDMNNEMAFSVIENSDGDYLILGSIEGYSGVSYIPNPIILKLDSSGNKIWAKILLDVTTNPTDVIQIQETTDGGFVATGKTGLNGDSFVFKVDSFGNISGCNIVAPNPPILNNNITSVALKSSPAIVPMLHSLNLDSSIDPTTNSITLVENNACAGPNNPPTVTTNNVFPVNYCADGLPGGVLLSWDFNDAEDGTVQTAYEIELTRSDTVVCSSGKQISSLTALTGTDINSFVGCSDFIKYGSYTYNWNIKVYDSNDDDSGFVAGNSFPSTSTPLHQYPTAKFSYSPTNPSLFQNITFDPVTAPNDSICYDNSNNPVACASFEWDFEDDGIIDETTFPASTDPNAYHSYSSSGTFTVDLKVTDSDGYSCWASQQGNTEDITIGGRPKWNEINP